MIQIRIYLSTTTIQLPVKTSTLLNRYRSRNINIFLKNLNKSPSK